MLSIPTAPLIVRGCRMVEAVYMPRKTIRFSLRLYLNFNTTHDVSDEKKNRQQDSSTTDVSSTFPVYAKVKDIGM